MPSFVLRTFLTVVCITVGCAAAGDPAPEVDAGPCDPVRAAKPITGIAAIATGTRICVALASGAVECWGDSVQPTARPIRVPGISTAVSVASNRGAVCAALKDGTVVCWLAKTPTEAVRPVAVPGLGGVTVMSMGGLYNCAVATEGRVFCWDDPVEDASGDLRISSPAEEMQGFSGATAIAAGLLHVCAVAGDGAVWCWGLSALGAIGPNADNHGTSYVPVIVPGLAGATSIAAGVTHSCASLADGNVWCWGSNLHMALGFPNHGLPGADIPAMPQPQQVAGLAQVTSVAAGGASTCAVLADRTVRCWGNNERGALGDATRRDAATPVRVIGLGGVRSLSLYAGMLGTGRACALLTDGRAMCWGHLDSCKVTLMPVVIAAP
jgi:hypothetical protein